MVVGPAKAAILGAGEGPVIAAFGEEGFVGVEGFLKLPFGGRAQSFNTFFNDIERSLLRLGPAQLQQPHQQKARSDNRRVGKGEGSAAQIHGALATRGLKYAR